MKFKPSELPVGVVIEDETETLWEQGPPGIWWAVDVHCPDCTRVCFTAGPSEENKDIWQNAYEVIYTPADVYFSNFKIISLPMSVVEELLEDVAFARGVSEEQALKDALEAVANKAKPKDEKAKNWKKLHSFEYIWLEINELGQIRTGDDVIHDPVFDEGALCWMVAVKDEDQDLILLDINHFYKQCFDKDYKGFEG
ncbi:hypothetical protein PP914_gp223 [Arthrobacter phage Qui]|uniref:DUF2262 domain-containing protein n=1 Tax=Arthrobacter phage Qui TaxID=2603260 RepID=A0A5B8WHC7_9CAUD|nr:hypothetical protein PP914_gp223 [Arthrobacter phage Qui]QED11711.1 hypothetical protein SEA_QUI_223 [Arthrobacter phage Qui]QOC56542.1 hypothetical protein SEA_PAELLA_223 [Arthrobacter phage Paella]